MLRSLASHLSIKQSFLVSATLAVAMTVAMVGISFGLQYLSLFEQREQKLRELVQSARSVAQSFVERERRGELTREQAVGGFAAAQGPARFAGDNYFVLVGYDGTMRMHANPKLVGSNMLAAKDAGGRLFIQEAVDVARGPGQGFTRFDWIKPGDTVPTLKLLYVIGIPEWEMYVAAGEHVDDIISAFWTSVGHEALIVAPALVVFSVVVFLLAKAVIERIGLITGSMQALAAGDLNAPVPARAQTDEVGAMARAVQTFKEQAIDRDRLEREALLHRRDIDDARRKSEDGRRDIEAERLVRADEQRLVVETLASALSALSDGDLRHEIDAEFPENYRQLKSDFNQAVGRMRQTMRLIAGTARSIAVSADEVRLASGDLARRTEDQSASLEETAAATEQLAASVKASADTSTHASQRAEEAMTVAEQGGSIVSDAVVSMSRIEEASRRIWDITAVIDGIAFQTNLLALNAAVEAARAGDAGKGFAVVASEVRTLAQRSSDASRNITSLISSSTREIAQGVALVRTTGERLDKIVAASRQVAEAVAEISRSSSEQSHGIEEISTAVARMDGMTQQNAAHAEQGAASATALTSQIRQLDGLISVFKLDVRGDQGAGKAASLGTPAGADLASVA